MDRCGTPRGAAPEITVAGRADHDYRPLLCCGSATDSHEYHKNYIFGRGDGSHVVESTTEANVQADGSRPDRIVESDPGFQAATASLGTSESSDYTAGECRERLHDTGFEASAVASPDWRPGDRHGTETRRIRP